MKEMVRINVTIEKRQKDWLSKNRSVNASGLLQEAIDARMKGK